MQQDNFYSKYDDHSSISKVPLVRSRFEEQPMYPISINDSTCEGDIVQSSSIRRYCRLFANISLIVGITMMVTSILFKLQSRGHITEAIEQDCPAQCVTTCYGNLPFPPNKNVCDDVFFQGCEEQCGLEGIDKARLHATLFLIFVSVGGLLVVVQIIHGCAGYCCYSHALYKKEKMNQMNQMIPL